VLSLDDVFSEHALGWDPPILKLDKHGQHPEKLAGGDLKDFSWRQLLLSLGNLHGRAAPSALCLGTRPPEGLPLQFTSVFPLCCMSFGFKQWDLFKQPV